MSARLWKGVAASAAGADACGRHVTAKVLSPLSALEGHRGARGLRRDHEFLVVQ